MEEMIEISTENVKRITVWLKPELLSRMDGWLETANCKNRSEFITKALRFYMGYLATDDVSSYVCESVSQNIRGILTENTNRISKLMFKWSVELNMMMHIVAAHFKDDVSDLRALRGYSADEVILNCFFGQTVIERIFCIDNKLPVHFSVQLGYNFFLMCSKSHIISLFLFFGSLFYS